MSVRERDDRAGRVGPFVTFVEHVRRDGAVAHWDSRRHRKYLRPALAAGSTWWAPRARGWWIEVLSAAVRGRRGPWLRECVSPATGQLRNAERSNLGTLIGALCFLAGASLLLPERTESE